MLSMRNTSIVLFLFLVMVNVAFARPNMGYIDISTDLTFRQDHMTGLPILVLTGNMSNLHIY